jgi:hypothetical protein
VKVSLAALGLLIACGPLQAQVILEKPKPAPPSKKEQKTVKKADAARPAEPDYKRHSGHRPQHERPPQTRETSEGTVKLDRARPPETQRPSSAPSPAQQMQQQQFEQRQQQSQRQSPQKGQPSNASGIVQCNARPVCGGSYGRCAAVAQTYQGATLQAGRREIIQACVAANTPDSCNCAAQCTSVARCSIF